MSNALLLIGERALELRERLEASGYSTLGWSGAEVAQSLQSQLVNPGRVQAVLLTSDELPLVPLLQRHCGAGELVPLLVEVEADDLAARTRVLEVGANDFWIHQAPPSELLRKLRQQLDVHARLDELGRWMHLHVGHGAPGARLFFPKETAHKDVRRGRRGRGAMLAQKPKSLCL